MLTFLVAAILFVLVLQFRAGREGIKLIGLVAMILVLSGVMLFIVAGKHF